MTHERVKLKLPSGCTVDAIAPVILSVSRSTDIPAFHTEWFINRWKAGYSVWVNPYSNAPQYVSFEKVKGIVFWTKNPSKEMIEFQKELEKDGVHTYFQYTLNDYENEKFEPFLPSLDQRIERFIELSKAVGSDRVIWRFDPLFLMNQDTLISRIKYIGDKLRGYTHKLVFSFVDINCYKKVQANLIKYTDNYNERNVLDAEYTPELMESMASRLATLRDMWIHEGWDIELATCGEVFDLDKYKIQHNRCIDSEQFKKIAKDDAEFMNYLTYGGMLTIKERTPKQLKDPGQRLVCGCMLSKDIGMYNTCPHFCVYCYANASRELVTENFSKRNVNSESIVPMIYIAKLNK